MKTKNERRGLQNSGTALPLVMVALVMLLMLGVGLLSIGLHGRIFAIRTASQITARCAADAGLAKAVFEMNEKLKIQPWSDSTLPAATDEALPYCDATYSYVVTGSFSGGYTVESVGKSADATKRVIATLRLGGIFDWGIVVKETATLMAGTLVDGYDSSGAAADVGVRVGTVSEDVRDIILKTGVHVDGEVLYGIDYYFPEVDPPLWLLDKAAGLSATGTTLSIGSADSGQYTNIDLQQKLMPTGPNTTATVPGILEIGGDVTLYITGDVWLGNSCEIIIKPDSSLTMYVDGNFITGNSSGVNNQTQIPKNFLLFGTGVDQKFELKAKEDWYGAVYAPYADVIIKAKGDSYGAFVAENFENKASGNTWYDGALSDVKLDDEGARFVIKRWYED
ncbi:MAG: DUF7305 domain-containing protein [Planctomycetota bacterium]|jgi:hypothetical protein